MRLVHASFVEVFTGYTPHFIALGAQVQYTRGLCSMLRVDVHVLCFYLSIVSVLSNHLPAALDPTRDE